MDREYKALSKGRARLRDIFVLDKDTTTIEYHCPINV